MSLLECSPTIGQTLRLPDQGLSPAGYGNYMGRDSDPHEQGLGAVFHTNRRSPFAVRNPQESKFEHKKRAAPKALDKTRKPSPRRGTHAKLGLDGNWSRITEAVEASNGHSIGLTFGIDQSDEIFIAQAVASRQTTYFAAASDDNQIETDGRKIILDGDLFEIIRSKSAVIAMDLGDAKSARLVSYKSVAEIFERAAEPVPDADNDTASNDSPDVPEKEPLQEPAEAPEPEVVATEPEPPTEVTPEPPVEAETEVQPEPLAEPEEPVDEPRPAPETAAEPEPKAEPEIEPAIEEVQEIASEEPPVRTTNRVRTSPISRILPPEETQAPPAPSAEAPRLKAIMPPRGFPDSLLDSLREQIKLMGLDSNSSTLIQVEYVDSQSEFVVAFAGTPVSAQDALETLVSNVLASSRRKDIELGIAFFDADDQMANRIARIGTSLN